MESSGNKAMLTVLGWLKVAEDFRHHEISIAESPPILP
jgi:hypothetical protein